VSGTALILAAHGSRHDPAVNAAILGYAATIAEGARFDEVGVGFHQGTPHFSECIDRLTGDQVVVVPVMTSAGWYRRIALPRELARNHRLPLCHVVITEPVGTHPEMVERFARRAGCIVRECEFVPAEVSLAIVGHGTRRFSDSRCATESLAGALRSRAGFAEVLVAFLDDDPAVDTLMDRARQGNLIVIPFLVANGPHAARDIPAALGLVSPPGTALPVSGRVNGRK
jgi:sirohydrochlorin cobaltochelatase